MNNQERADSLASITWFLMDSMWMLGFDLASKIMIIPCVIFVTAGFFYADKNIHRMLPQAALLSWLSMNIFWMTEFMMIAKCCLGIGVLCILLMLILDREQLLKFRRFK